VSGHPWLGEPWQRFLAQARGERLPHALLLAGPSGTGKLELARDMASWLLCTQPGDTACGACRSCRLLPGGAHPDLFTVLPEDERGLLPIDAIRELVASLTLTTTISQRKVALIAPAEGMNVNAANALLKCLEEPPGATVMLLVSHDPRRLPITIRSRCQLLPVPVPDRGAAIAWLTQTTGASQQHCELALLAASGSPLTAAQLLAEDSVDAFGELRGSLAELLGAPERAGACASALADWDARRLWSWLSLNLADALRARLADEPADWLPPARQLSAAGLARLQHSADRNRALAPTTVRQDLLLHHWLIEWARLPKETAGT